MNKFITYICIVIFFNIPVFFETGYQFPLGKLIKFFVYMPPLFFIFLIL
jgi:hypothetical protein